MTALEHQLADIVGPEHVLVDPDLRAGYETDWTGRFRGTAGAVVRPASAAETAAVLAVCAAKDVAVVPQGGNTGMVGASVPRGNGMLVISTRRMTSIAPADTAASQISLGAGVTISQWRDAARAAGLDAPIDFGARDSATVGGATATNAGGSRVVRFGTMRRQVMGVVAALSTGATVGSLIGLPKETIGLHWPSLFCGSEGTLSVITDVRLRLVPWYRHRAAALIALPLTAAVELLAVARSELTHLDAVELLLPNAMDVAAEHLGRRPPVAANRSDGVDAYVLIECADHDDPTDDLVELLAAATRVTDSAIASDPAGVAELGQFRDRMAESISTLGVPLKLDVAVQPGALPAAVAAARDAVESVDGNVIAFGHLAEGNLHLNLVGPQLSEGRYAMLDPSVIDDVSDTVLRRIADLGGTISAEHGVGIAKSKWLPLVRTPEELDAAAAIRTSLDPAGILNRGVLTA